MKNPLFILFGILSLLWLFLASFLSGKYCNCNAAAAAAVPAVIMTNDQPEKSIAITDGENNFAASANDNLLFPSNTCDYLTPVSASLQQVFTEAVTHLQANSDRILVLTGLAKNDETNGCESFNDLGLARAQMVKNMLVELGGPAERIRLESDVREMKMFDENVLGGVEYKFISGDIGDVEERLRMSNITLYFETNEQNLSLTTEQQRYFDDLKFFIGQKPDAKISVGGHTDNAGQDNWNRRLSRKRAEFVRDYMVENGIPKKNLIAEGFGPSEPIDTNDTKDGRAKNRRVEVKIQ